MSQQLSTQHDDGKLSTWLARPDVAERIASALGGYADPDAFISHHLIHIQSKPELAECSVASQYQAIHTCAMLGLFAGLQQVALIPRAKQLTVMPQWQGLKALFERVPEVFEVRAALVHVNDVFEVAGDGPDLAVTRHVYDPFDPQRKIEQLEDIRGAYCVFTFRDGRPPRYHFVPAAYISKCRACAQTKNVWDKWFEQMALKTAFRSAYSRRVVNVDPLIAGRVEAFLRHEDALLGNDPRIIDSPPPTQVLPPVSRSAALAGRLTQPAPVLPPGPPPPSTHQATDEPPKEPMQERAASPGDGTPAEGPSGTETAAQPGGGESGGGRSVMSEFLDLIPTVKTARDWERLRDWFTGPQSHFAPSDEERREINRICAEGAREASNVHAS